MMARVLGLLLVNSVFEKKGISITSLNDLRDGIRFLQLLEILTNQTQKFNHNPNNRLQKIQNCAISINWMENLGVDIRFISPHNIVDGSRRAILSCLYAIKRRFTQGEKDPKIFRTTSNKEVDVKRVTNVEITGPGREDEVKKLQKEKKNIREIIRFCR